MKASKRNTKNAYRQRRNKLTGVRITLFSHPIKYIASGGRLERCIAAAGSGAGAGGSGDRRRNATGNQFQEGRGPLPRRISPGSQTRRQVRARLRHLRQHRPMRRRPPRRALPLHSKRHWLRNQSNALSAFYLIHAPGPYLPNIAHSTSDACKSMSVFKFCLDFQRLSTSLVIAVQNVETVTLVLSHTVRQMLSKNVDFWCHSQVLWRQFRSNALM